MFCWSFSCEHDVLAQDVVCSSVFVEDQTLSEWVTQSTSQSWCQEIPTRIYHFYGKINTLFYGSILCYDDDCCLQDLCDQQQKSWTFPPGHLRWGLAGGHPGFRQDNVYSKSMQILQDKGSACGANQLMVSETFYAINLDCCRTITTSTCSLKTPN